MQGCVVSLRNACMEGMYRETTVNLCHVAATLIFRLMAAGTTQIEKGQFHRLIYLAVKSLQKVPHIYLHRKLQNPEAYSGILHGEAQGLRQFLQTAMDKELIKIAGQNYQFLTKITELPTFDQVRLENPLLVYANEMAPLRLAIHAIEEVALTGSEATAEEMARHRLDDERVRFHWEKYLHTEGNPSFDEVNLAETASANAEPYFLRPAEPLPLGVLLVHGFLASPAELREYGQQLHVHGYTVLGVRLPGHGTSPWDLRERSFEEWLKAVARGYETLSVFCSRICIIGFSTGGALALLHGASRPPGLAGVVSVCAPMRFKNPNMVFVPILHGANEISRWAPGYEGVMPFRPNLSEHPDINYRHMPVRGLYELRRMVAQLEKALPIIRCPVAAIQASHDQVVDPVSLTLLHEGITLAEKTMVLIPSHRHGILSEDIGITRPVINAFLAEKCPRCPE
jgi:esterase/lipase